MIYTTDKGVQIKAKEGKAPEFNEFHQRWYLWGYRWIKSTGKFSGNCSLHNAEQFTPA